MMTWLDEKHVRLRAVLLPWLSPSLQMLLALTLAGCAENQAASSGKGKGKDGKGEVRFSGPPKPVRAVKIEKVPMERVVIANGSLAALEQSTLSIKVPGRIQSTPIDLGYKVRRGDLVVQVERHDYELKLKQSEALLAQARARLGLSLRGDDDQVDAEKTSTVNQARAVLDEAAKNRERIEKLSGRGISSQSDLEAAQSNYEVAANKYQTALEDARDRIGQLSQRRTEVDIARQQLNDTAIVAPYDGVIQDRRANVGEYLNIGAPVATIVRTDPLRLRVEVAERDAPAVRAGLRVRLTLEGDTNVYTGEVSRLSPAITEQNRMLIVEADVRNNGKLRPGSFARAEIVVEEEQPTIAVPRDALVTFAGIEKVFLVKDGKAVEKTVSTGRRTDQFIEIARDLKPGDQVVLSPGSLQNGQPVTIEVGDAPKAVKAAKSGKAGGGGKKSSGP